MVEAKSNGTLKKSAKSWITSLLNWKSSNGADSNKKATTHPKLNIPIKFAFSIERDYYQLENDFEIPEMRMRYALRFQQEMEFKCTVEYLKEFCEKGLKELNKGRLIKTAELIRDLEYRLGWSFEPDSVYRLASVIYFDLEENIEGYDKDYNDRKIEEFKKKEITFFLQMLMSESSQFTKLSKEDLKTYLDELKKIKGEQEKRLKT